jgi:hypothetical protein
MMNERDFSPDDSAALQKLLEEEIDYYRSNMKDEPGKANLKRRREEDQQR